MTKVQVHSISVDDAACRCGQDDGSSLYHGLRINATIDGVYRSLFFRCAERAYPGNDAVIHILNQLTLKEQS